ncbi:MAG TPA: hypothetical protein VEJ18_03255 [Planctomycetota bacterium]|nr:hypothetical protein [Planctomycetota bacterium]
MAQISKLIRKKLGDLLVEAGTLKEDQLREAHLRMRATGESLVETLGLLGFATEMEVAKTVSKQFGLPFIDASRYRIPKEAVEAVPVAFQRQNQLAVLDRIGKTLIVAVAGVLNGEIFDKLEKSSGGQLFLYVSTLSRVMTALEKAGPAAAGKK